MDSPFKSSFIPKQVLNESPRRRPRTIGFFTLLAIMVFLTSIGVSAGVYFYQGYLEKNIAQMREDLARARASFDPARIEEFRRLDTRIAEAKRRLDAHTAPTLLFDLLQTNTLLNVRYKRFDYSTEKSSIDKSSMIKITIDGQARNFSAVALQSDTFGTNKNVLNPIFKDMNPDVDGFVDFTVDALVSPDFISYGNSLGFGTIETPQPAGGVYQDRSGSFGVSGIEPEVPITETMPTSGIGTTTKTVPVKRR